MKKLLSLIFIAFISFSGYTQIGLEFPEHQILIVKCEVYDSTESVTDIVENGINVSEVKNIRVKCDKLEDKRKYRINVTAYEGKTELTRKTSFSSITEFKIEKINTNVADKLLIELDIKDNFQSFSIPLNKE